jgi:hypothetical protein
MPSLAVVAHQVVRATKDVDFSLADQASKPHRLGPCARLHQASAAASWANSSNNDTAPWTLKSVGLSSCPDAV